MHASYLVNGAGPNTYSAVAEDYYAVYTRGSAADVDPARLQRVVDELVRANPDVVLDNGKFDSGTVAIRLPLLPELGLLPPVVGSIATPTFRNELLEAGFRDHRAIAASSIAFLQSKLPAVNTADLQEIQELCSLLEVPGVNAAIAHNLHAAGISSPGELGSARQSDVRTAIERVQQSPVESLVPLEDEQSEPAIWSLLVFRAASMAPPPVKDVNPVFGVPAKGDELRTLRTRWRAMAKNPNRTLKENNSSEAIANAYSLASHLMDAHRALGDGSPKGAEFAYTRLLQEVANLAGVGLKDLTINDVVAVCVSQLELVAPADLASCTRAARLPQARWASVDGFNAADLEVTHFDTAKSAAGALSLTSFGKVLHEAVARAHSETTVQELTQLGSVTPSFFGSPNQAARFVDLSDDDKTQANQIFKTLTVSQLSSKYAEISPALRLRSVADGLGTSTPNFFTDVSAIQDTVRQTLPGPIQNSPRKPLPTELFISGQKGDTEFGGVVASDLATHYQAGVLDPLLGSSDPSALWMTPEDVLDPGRFLSLLPFFVAHHVPLGLARAYSGRGRHETAAAFRSFASRPQGQSSNFNVAYEDWVGHGEVTTDLSTMGWAQAREEATTRLLAGDRSFQDGDYENAALQYRKGLEADLVHETTSFLAENFDSVLYEIEEKISLALAQGKPLPDLSIRDALIEDDAGNHRPLLDNARRLVPGRPLVTTAGAAWGGQPVQLYNSLNPKVVFAEAEAMGEHQIPAPGVAEQLDAAEHQLRLRQIELGLNWLGFDEMVVPSWTFDRLIQLAQRLATQAESWQNRARTLLESKEQAELAELGAGQRYDLQIAEKVVASAQYAVGAAQLNQANIALEQFESGRALATAAAISNGIGALASSISMASGTRINNAQNAESGLGYDAQEASGNSSQFVGATNELTGIAGTLHQLSATKEVLESQQATAVSVLALRSSEIALAELRREQAQAVVNLLSEQELDSYALESLARQYESLGQAMLFTANQMGWLAQRAYIFETRSLTSMVQTSYYSRQTVGGRFASASRLVADLAALASHRLLNQAQTVHQVKTTISLFRSYPSALMALRSTGRTIIRLSQRDLDLRFPGLYLHKTRRIVVEFDGVFPPAGVNGLLHMAPASRIRVPNEPGYIAQPSDAAPDWAYESADAPFVLAPVLGYGQTMVLSQRTLGDAATLSVDAGAQDQASHTSPAGLWLLELPATSNLFDLRAIADVRLVVEFTAEYSTDLAAAQEAALSSSASVPISTGALATGRNSSGPSRRSFRDGPLDSDLDFARYFNVAFDEADLHANSIERRVTNIDVAFPGLQEQLVARLLGSHDPFGAKGTTNDDNALFSAIGEIPIVNPDDANDVLRAPRTIPGSPFDAMVSKINTHAGSQSAVGSWIVKACAADNADLLALDSTGQPIVHASGYLDLGGPSTGVVTRSDELFENARVRIILGELVAGNSLAVTARSGASTVTARLSVDGAHLVVELQAGSSTWRVTSAQSVVLDPTYELDLWFHGEYAHVVLDRVLVLSKRVPYVLGESGPLLLEAGAAAGPTRVHRVLVDRSSAGGTLLERALTERFTTLDWVVDSVNDAAALGVLDRQVLDLTSLDDVGTLVSYDVRPSAPPNVNQLVRMAGGGSLTGPTISVPATGAVLVVASLVVQGGDGSKLLSTSSNALRFFVEQDTLILELWDSTETKVSASFHTTRDLTKPTLYWARWGEGAMEFGIGDPLDGASQLSAVAAGLVARVATPVLFDPVDPAYSLEGALSVVMLDRQPSDKELARVAQDLDFSSLAFEPQIILQPQFTVESGQPILVDTDISDIAGPWSVSGSLQAGQ